MTKDEALKLALEALESCNWVDDGGYGHAEYDHVSTNKAITAIREALEQPEFVTHAVENVEDWSEWVCPDPQSYLMKCCGCGLVHEMQFKVVRYKSKDEREECDVVDDPNLQAVFRMRRSEEWSPKDTAYRPGGLAQPEQEPVAEDVSIQGHFEADITMYYNSTNLDWDSAQEAYKDKWTQAAFCGWQSRQLIYTTPPHRKPLTDEEIDSIYTGVRAVHHEIDSYVFARAIEAKLKEKNGG